MLFCYLPVLAKSFGLDGMRRDKNVVNTKPQMARDILEFFPLPTPRRQQVQALHAVQDVVAQGYRDIALELPTGSGKSAIAATIAAWSNETLRLSDKHKPGAHILVQQKVLQDQIEAELDRLGGKEKAALIKASIEYPCPSYKRCSVGLLEYRCDCIKQGQCSYKLAKARFLKAKVAVTNYSYFFTETQHVGQIEPRHVLVCDEAHSLPRTLLRQADLAVCENRLRDFAPDIVASELYRVKTLEDFLGWLEDDYQPAVQSQAELLQALNDSDEQAKESYEVSQHLLKVDTFIARSKADPRGWVFWREEGRDRQLSLIVRPLDAAPYFDRLVAKRSPVRVYLSAFLGPKAIFCSELGLDPKRVAWMRFGSSFSPESRPVHLLSVGSMSRQNAEVTLPSLLKMVLRIAKVHATTRGILHTNSYRLADDVVNALELAGMGKRLVYPKNAEERDEALKQHAAQEDAILISPSVGEGFDFRGDRARWQIILKCPYPSLSDQHTVVRAERDPAWYKSETVKHFVQTCGRICRSDDDFGSTYVLDSDVARVLKETEDSLPRWFKAALLTAAGEPFFG